MGISQDNKNLAISFLRRTREDLEVAKELLKTKHYPDSTYHSQQCCEKAIKAILVLNKIYITEHMISGVFSSMVVLKHREKEWKKKLEKVLVFARDLEKHWVKPRYPMPRKELLWDPLKEYTREIAEEVKEKAEFVFKTLTSFLKEKYGLKLD